MIRSIFMLSGFMFSLAIAADANAAAACAAGDKEASRSAKKQSMVCVTSGYCTAWDYNTQTGRYEYFYGYHEKCDGEQKRTITDLMCVKPDGKTTYSVRHAGPWGKCKVI